MMPGMLERAELSDEGFDRKHRETVPRCVNVCIRFARVHNDTQLAVIFHQLLFNSERAAPETLARRCHVLVQLTFGK